MALADSPGFETLLLLKQVALFVFIALFLGVVFRLLVGRREVYEKRGQIPLFDDRIVEPRLPQAPPAPRRPGEPS